MTAMSVTDLVKEAGFRFLIPGDFHYILKSRLPYIDADPKM